MASEKLKSVAKGVKSVHIWEKDLNVVYLSLGLFRTVNILKMTMKTINGEGNAENAKEVLKLPGKINKVLSSVQFNRSILPNSLWPHEPKHARPPCPSPTPGVHPNPCPLSRWCHPTISSSTVPFSSRPQSFPASESFQMSQLFTSGSQSIGVSPSKSVLPMNTQDWSPCSPRDFQESSPTSQFRSINSLVLSFLYRPTLTSIHDYWKNHSLD